MKHNLFVFILLAISVAAARPAQAMDRDGFKFYFGGGDSHSWGSVAETGGTAQVAGEYYDFETGVELPIAINFGVDLGGEFGQSNLINSYSSTSYLEVSQITSEALRAGFYFSHFGIGGGYRVASLTINSVSSTSGGASTSLSGGGPMGYANLSFDLGTRARAAIEGQYNSITAGSLTISQMSVGLRFYLLFGGDR